MRQWMVKLKNTFGNPALSARTPSASAENGVSEAGRATNAHPAASAGPALRVIIAFGKFQGVIDAATPIGCLRTIILLSFDALGLIPRKLS